MEDPPNRKRPGFVPSPRDVTETLGRAQSAAPAERPGSICPLAWSMDAAARALGRFAAAGDAPEAVAAATEAVWWITTADAAMNRHHPAVYGHVLTALDPAARRAVEVSLAGLRFIRGQLGGNADPADFLEGGPAAGIPPAWT